MDGAIIRTINQLIGCTQSWCWLRANGPRLSLRPHPLHARRQRRMCSTQHQCACTLTTILYWHTRPAGPDNTTAISVSTNQRQPGRYSLYHLHFRLNRPPQRRGCQPSQLCPTLLKHLRTIQIRAARNMDFFPLLRLRLLSLGNMGSTSQRWYIADRSPTTGPLIGRFLPITVS